MAKLYDYRLGAGVLVADERVGELVLSGDYGFVKGEPVHLTDESGELYNIPPENALEALEAGYNYAPKEVVDDARMRFEVEDSPLTSAGYGFARSLTFGASDALLPNKKKLQLHRELNPVATTLSEIGGMITPMGATGLAARGATKATSMLLKAASKRAARTKGLKTAGSALSSRVVTGAARGAAEGAVVGTMYGTSSQLLDDPENYPTFADHVYAGAGFGAVAGGILSAIGGALKAGGGRFKKEADKAYFRIFDPKKKEWNDVTRKGKYPDAVYTLGEQIRKLDKKGVLQNLDDAEAMVKELDDVLLPAYGGKIDEIIEQVERAAKKAGISLEDIRFDPEKIAARMEQEIIHNAKAMGKGLVDDPIIVAKLKRAQKSIDAFREIAYKNLHPVLRKIGLKGRTLSFRESEELKRFYQRELANYKKNPDNYDYFTHMARIIREESENALDAIAGRLSQSDKISKSIYAEFIEAKEIYKALRQLRAIASGAAARDAVNNRLPLTSYIIGGGMAGGVFAGADSALTGGLGAAATFLGTAMLRKQVKDHGELFLARTLGRITDYGEMLNFAGKSESAISKSVQAIIRGGSAATVKIANPFPDSPKAAVKSFEKIKGDLEELNSNPRTLYKRMDAMLPDIEGDQTINSELAQTMSNVVNFLSEKLPGSTLGGQQLFYDSKQNPPLNSILKFLRHVEIANDPNKILQYIAAGKLTPEHMETIETVFPRLYQSQVEAILAGFISQNRTINLNSAVQQSLSMFLKKPTGRMYDKKFVQATQGAYAEKRQQGQKDGGGGGMQLNLPESATTVQQATAL